MLKTIIEYRKTLIKKQPLILNYTNFVSMELVANSLLALGALPIMSFHNSEVEALIAACSAIIINIGTLDKSFIKRINNIILMATRYAKPVILDPVGAGASTIRTKISRQLLPYACTIRGNASEIIALNQSSGLTKGVEATESVESAKQHAKEIAYKHRCTVIVSGAIDYITNGDSENCVPYGAKLMTKVTGMGCAHTAVVAAFRAVMDDSFQAALAATIYYTLCGSLASQATNMPGSFRTQFIDNLATFDQQKMSQIYV